MKRNVSTKHVGRRIKYDVHSFIADIYIAPLLVGLLRSAPNPARPINVVLSCWENTLGSDRRASGRPFHTKGPTTEKARLCVVEVRANGTCLLASAFDKAQSWAASNSSFESR